MPRFASPSFFAFVCALFAVGPVGAQRRVQYDTLSESTPAAISCGFCAGERFGMVFRPLDSGGGLRESEFPLTLESIELAVARTTVTGGLLEGGYECHGSTTGGTISMMIEVFAGQTPPRGDITTQPASGPWPGEVELFAESTELTTSVETSAGSAMYDVTQNTVSITSGVRVDPPSTYIRVAISIPAGGASASCADLGLEPPGAVGLRDDDGRIEENVGMIYAVNPLSGTFGIAEGWHWNEDEEITDPSGGGSGIEGDWAIRLDVSPIGSSGSDAGMSIADGGGASGDAGSSSGTDSGIPSATDGATGSTCTADRECAGGERCVAGACTRVTCATTADCGGGTTCAEGTCRALCSADSECRGGEVCDRAAGHCAPVAGSSAGCGCRAAGVVGHGRGRSAVPALALAMITLGASIIARRRRRAA
jgi:hypothetical protein